MRKLLLIAGLFIGSNLYAQFGLISTEVLNDVKEKKLLVELKVLSTTNTSDVSTTSKEDLKIFFDTYNKSVQEFLPMNWTLTNGDIEFKSPEEIDKMANEDLNNYVLFHSGWLKKTSQAQGSFLMYSFNIDYFNAKGKRVNIFEVAYIPDDLITGADIVFISKVIKNHIKASETCKKYPEYFDVEKNIALIGKKTLLLDNQFTELSLVEAKDAYEGKIEIVSPERIATEIENGSEDFTFIKLIWSNTKGYAMYDVFDTKDCNILSCIGTGGLKVDFAKKHKNYMGKGGESNFWDAEQYPYRNPYAGEDIYRVNLYKSELSIKKVHLKTMVGKSAQKINCK